MIEHTKVPWKTAYRKNPRTEMYAQEIFDENGETIATLSWYPVKKNDHTTTTNREANASRIVACVNACEGISTRDIKESSPFDLAVKFKRQLDKALEVLCCEAVQLEAWAVESRKGGWPTHQVGPMNKRAAELRAIASRIQGEL